MDHVSLSINVQLSNNDRTRGHDKKIVKNQCFSRANLNRYSNRVINARFVSGKFSYRESVTSMLNDLDWPPLQQKGRINDLIHSSKQSTMNHQLSFQNTSPEYNTTLYQNTQQSLHQTMCKLQTVQEQLHSTHNPQLECATSRPDAFHICRPLQLSSADIHYTS